MQLKAFMVMMIALSLIGVASSQTITNKQIILDKDKIMEFSEMGITGFHYEDHSTDEGYYRCIRSNINDNAESIAELRNDILGCSGTFKGNYTESVLDEWGEDFIRNYKTNEEEETKTEKEGIITISEASK